MPSPPKLLRVKTRAAWRKWLEEHSTREKEIWLVFAKAGSGQPRVTYDDALEEALCFGWIDTTVRRLDEQYYMQRFTPRSNPKNWSKANLARFDRLEKEGLMTDAGRVKRPAGVRPPPRRVQADDRVPPFITRALVGHPRAKTFWDTLAPGYRRDYVRYITEAKKEETRMRRLAIAIQRLEDGWKRVLESATGTDAATPPRSAAPSGSSRPSHRSRARSRGAPSA